MSLKRIIFMFILPLLIFSVVLGTIQSITDHSINPRHDSMIDQLQEFSREANIGESLDNEPDRAEAQFRGLVTFNMLAAQNCLYPSLVYNYDQAFGFNEDDFYEVASELDEIDENDPSEVEELETQTKELFDYEQKPYIIHGNPSVMADGERTSDLGGQTYFSYGAFANNFGEPELMRVLVEDEDYSLTCMGADPLPVTGYGSLKDIISANLGRMIQAGAAFGTVAGATGLGATLGGPIGAAIGFAGASAYIFTLGVITDDEPTLLDDFEGNSAQGKFGQVEITLHENFTIQEPGLFAMRKPNARHSNAAASNPEPAPDFLMGQRASVFFPHGIKMGQGSVTFENNQADTGVTSASTERRRGRSVSLGDDFGESQAGSGPTSGTARRRYIMGYHSWVDDYKNKERRWEDMFNAFRVRMVNVPIVANEDSPEASNTRDMYLDQWPQGSDTDRSETRTQYRRMVLNLDYVMCEGMNGYVQSNAGTIRESGKGHAGESISTGLRDVVYPKVEITDYEGISKEECYEEHPRVDDYDDLVSIDANDLAWYEGEEIMALESDVS